MAEANVKELIAVNHFFAAANTQTLKRQALMFNRISIAGLNTFLSIVRAAVGENSIEIAEFEWLCEKGIIFESIHDKSANIQNEEYQQINSIAKFYGHKLEKNFHEYGLEDIADVPLEILSDTEQLRKFIGDKAQNINKLVESEVFAKNLVIAFDFYIRGLSIQLRELHGLDAYPIISDIPLAKQQPSNTSEIIEIVLNTLPVPDDNTPWEQIIDFRLDSQSMSKFMALKNWMNDVARMKLKPSEVAEKLEWLLEDYRQHMHTHKIKTRLATLKTIAIAEAGFITSGWLTGLGALPGVIGMIATPLYTIKQRQVALMVEEQKAPGKEVAYIIKARETFE
jgi:hypothetical protein